MVTADHCSARVHYSNHCRCLGWEHFAGLVEGDGSLVEWFATRSFNLAHFLFGVVRTYHCQHQIVHSGDVQAVHRTDVIFAVHLAVVKSIVAAGVLHDETFGNHLGKLEDQLGVLSSAVCEQLHAPLSKSVEAQ